MQETPALESLKVRKQKAERVTGKKAIPVRVQLQILRDNGILIDLNITGSGMFAKAATFDEVGFLRDATKDARYGWIKPGTKYLIPEPAIKQLKSVVTRMRQCFDNHSRKVTGLYPYNWMPYTAHPEWVKKWTELHQEFETIKAGIIANRDTYVDEIAREYERVALASWQSMAAQDNGKVLIAGEQMDMEAFISYMVEKAIGLVPTEEEIASKLQADYITALVYGESDFALEQAEVQRVQNLASADKEKADIENKMLLEELRFKVWNNQAEQSERDIKIDAMRQVELERARDQLKETVSPFVEVYKQALDECTERAAELLEAVRKGGVVRGKIAEKGRGLLSFYNMMLIPELTDERMSKMLVELQGLLGDEGTKDESRDVTKIASKLQQIVELQNVVADEVESGGHKFSAIEV